MSQQSLRTRADASFTQWGHWVFGHPWLVIISVLTFSVHFISQVRHLEIDTSIEGFLLEDDPILIVYNDFRDRFERDDLVTVTIRPPEIFDFKFLEKLRKLHQELEDDLKYLDEVTSLINARSTRGVEGELIVEDLFEDWPENEAELAVIRDRARENPIYENLLLSQNGELTTLAIRFSTYSESSDEIDLSGFDDEAVPLTGEPSARPFLTGAETLEAVAGLYAILERYDADDFELEIAGAPILTSRLTNEMTADMGTFLVVSILATAVFLYLLFRRISATLIPVGIVLLSLLTTVGFMPLLDIPMQLPTQILPAFLLAVGIGDSVHILAIFYQYRGRGESKQDSIAHALGHSGFPVLMTSLTTAGALLSFTSASLAPIHNLGIIAPIGVFFAFIYTITLVPALLAVVPIGEAPRHGARLGVVDRMLEQCAVLSTTRPWSVVAVSCAILLIGIAGATQLRFSHNPVAWFPEGDPLRVSMDVMNDELKGIMSIEVLFETDKENGLQDPELLSTMKALQVANDDLRFGEIYIGKSLSLVDILEEIHQALNGGQAEFHVIPEDRQLIAQELLLFETSGSDDLEDVTDSLFMTGRMTLRAPWVDAYLYAPVMREIESIYQEAVGSMAKVTVTGLMPLLSRTFEAVIHSMARSYVIALVVITPLMMLLLSSVRLGLLSMIPNLLPIVLILGVMGYFEFPLDGFTLLIGSIALGLAVDDTIHFMNSFRRYYEETGDATQAVHLTLRTAGQAMLVTTLVLCAGFFVFTLGYLTSTFNFGFLTGLALAMAFIGDVTLAPALMVIVIRRREARAAAS